MRASQAADRTRPLGTSNERAGRVSSDARSVRAKQQSACGRSARSPVVRSESPAALWGDSRFRGYSSSGRTRTSRVSARTTANASVARASRRGTSIVRRPGSSRSSSSRVVPGAVEPGQPVCGDHDARRRAKLELDATAGRDEGANLPLGLGSAIQRLLKLRDEQRGDRGEPVDIGDVRIRRRERLLHPVAVGLTDRSAEGHGGVLAKLTMVRAADVARQFGLDADVAEGRLESRQDGRLAYR
jgi:hypothetical protein